MCSHRFSVAPQSGLVRISELVVSVRTAGRIILFMRETEGVKEDGELIRGLHLCGGQRQGHPDASPLK